jgi:hypothetical protein
MAPWMQQKILNNIQRSEDAFNTEPYRPFTGQRFAPRNVFERRTANLAKQRGQHIPHINASEQAAAQAAEQFPQHYQRYMDPYQEAVVNRISELGNRNMMENILPQLEAKFVRLGQHGGSRHGELAQRAARDIQSEISGRQAEALSHGYGQAMGAFNADQARMMELAKHQAELGSMTVAQRLAELSNLRQQAAMERELAERPLQLAEMEHRERHAYPFKQRAAHSATLYRIPSYAAPYDEKRSLHNRDWKNVGLRAGAQVASGLFGGGI